MVIKSVNPAIICARPIEVVSFYEENFGFHAIHKSTIITSQNSLESACVLENDEGVRLDVIYFEGIDVVIHGMRVDVDDFEAALESYRNDGYSPICDPIETRTSKRALISKGDGAPILLMRHLK